MDSFWRFLSQQSDSDLYAKTSRAETAMQKQSKVKFEHGQNLVRFCFEQVATYWFQNEKEDVNTALTGKE